MSVSPLRYAGGKSRVVHCLDAHFSTLGLCAGTFTYYEPMCGSLTVGLHVLRNYKPRQAYIADVSPDIINFFTVLRSEYAGLLTAIEALLPPEGLHSDAYYSLRHRFNAKKDAPVEAAALFYLLNRGGFNGVYRVNGKGEYNVPYGNFRTSCPSMTTVHRNLLHSCHVTLAENNVVFECVDVECFMRRHGPVIARDGDSLLYCDPPYLNADRSLYHPIRDFDVRKHGALRELLGVWSKCAHVVLNYADGDLVRSMYESGSWDVRELVTSRSVSACAGSRRAAIAELLITRSPPATPKSHVAQNEAEVAAGLEKIAVTPPPVQLTSSAVVLRRSGT